MSDMNDSYTRPDDVLDGHGLVFGDTGRTEIVKPRQRSSIITQRPDDFLGGSGRAFGAPKGPKRKMISNWIGGKSGDGSSDHGNDRTAPLRHQSAGASFKYKATQRTTDSSQNPMFGHYSVAVHGGTGKSSLFNESNDSMDDSKGKTDAKPEMPHMSVSDFHFSPDQAEKEKVKADTGKMPSAPSLEDEECDETDVQKQDEGEEMESSRRNKSRPLRVKSLPKAALRNYCGSSTKTQESPAADTPPGPPAQEETAAVVTPTAEDPAVFGPITYLNREGTIHVTPDAIIFQPNDGSATEVKQEWKLRSQVVDVKVKAPKMKLAFPSSWPVNERNPMFTFHSRETLTQAHATIVQFLPRAKGGGSALSSPSSTKKQPSDEAVPKLGRATTTSPQSTRKRIQQQPSEEDMPKLERAFTAAPSVEVLPPKSAPCAAASISCSNCSQLEETIAEQTRQIQQLQLEKEELQTKLNNVQTNPVNSDDAGAAVQQEQLQKLQQENDGLKVELANAQRQQQNTSATADDANDKETEELQKENEELKAKLKAATRKANHLTNKMNTIKMLLDQTDDSDGDAVIRYK